MQAAWDLSRIKGVLKIFHAIMHPEILVLVGTVALVVKREFSGRPEPVKGV